MSPSRQAMLAITDVRCFSTVTYDGVIQMLIGPGYRPTSGRTLLRRSASTNNLLVSKQAYSPESAMAHRLEKERNAARSPRRHPRCRGAALRRARLRRHQPHRGGRRGGCEPRHPGLLLRQQVRPLPRGPRPRIRRGARGGPRRPRAGARQQPECRGDSRRRGVRLLRLPGGSAQLRPPHRARSAERRRTASKAHHLSAGQEALAAISAELGLDDTESGDAAQLLLSIIALCWFPLIHARTVAPAVGVEFDHAEDFERRKRHVVDLVLHGVRGLTRVAHPCRGQAP